jgi:hypothetical protein
MRTEVTSMSESYSHTVLSFLIVLSFYRCAFVCMFLFNSVNYVFLLLCIEDRGSTVVKVLCYKSEGPWFDSR